ncbi:TlyA family RNA methyltransferase [Marinomonas ostreistagni]|uniref:TlyA family RNA methyltransferase n=1 Tax=Marinomonas ostreistagni TaxID=359209 RepID=A0ABS0Z6B3_9GAMM|nr:TlyA family RNA methyltransferase [Marinomonas ostreistagni]MBJ7549200.1 TlyA family RNA methyltransferase [Marinomonas ostreistagni]
MKRIDQLLTEKQLCKSRSQAQTFISQGKVFIFDKGIWVTVAKPSLKVSEDVEIKLELNEDDRYVSRGALKLAGALSASNLNIQGYTVLDVGQSTGGFTDCALQHGAARVVGVEVGHDQLDRRLRERDDVVCLEGLNARHLSAKDLGEHFPEKGFDAAVMDVSFISQTKILPQLPSLIRSGGYLITLVKPQFELGKDAIGKGGIVKDQHKVRQLETDMRQLIQQLGFSVISYEKSVIKGGDGNQEFVLLAQRS